MNDSLRAKVAVVLIITRLLITISVLSQPDEQYVEKKTCVGELDGNQCSGAERTLHVREFNIGKWAIAGTGLIMLFSGVYLLKGIWKRAKNERVTV